VLVASGIAMADGRNEFIRYQPLTTGAYRVKVSGEGSKGEYFLTKNFSPAVSVTMTPSVNENDIATLAGTISDPDPLDTHTVVINWGAGEGSTTLNLAAGVTTFSATHQYLDDNPSGTASDVYPIGVAVTDNHGASGSASTSTTVNNAAPSALVANSGTIDENGTFTLTGSFADPGTQDTHTLVINWGPGEGTTTLNLAAGVTAFSASHQYVDDNASGTASDIYPISLALTDDDTGATSAATSVTVNNVAPVLSNVAVTAVIDENGTATLTGNIADVGAQDSFTLNVAWGDGQISTYTYGAGTTSFSVSHQYLDDNPSGTPSDVYDIILTLTDDDTRVTTAATSVTVNNVAPVVGPVGGPSPSPSVRGQTLAFSGSFSHVGSQDTHQVSWDFGDGTVIGFHPSTDAGALAPMQVYAAAGNYTVTLTVRDDDTGTTSSSQSITIAVVALQDDPFIPGATDLVVGGANDANDLIRFNPVGSDGTIELTLNGVSLGNYQPTGRLIAFGQGGNDDIEVASSINLMTWLYGNAGSDRLKAAGGISLVMGGDGNDLLLGASGRSVLIGGTGADRLIGGSGEDILIGGPTSHDGHDASLFSILAEWGSSRTYAERVDNLRGMATGPRLNGDIFLTNVTVLDDGVEDKMTGASALDWFWAFGPDRITDDRDEEFLG
jgi:large repetitive protein